MLIDPLRHAGSARRSACLRSSTSYPASLPRCKTGPEKKNSKEEEGSLRLLTLLQRALARQLRQRKDSWPASRPRCLFTSHACSSLNPVLMSIAELLHFHHTLKAHLGPPSTLIPFRQTSRIPKSAWIFRIGKRPSIPARPACHFKERTPRNGCFCAQE